MRLALDVCVWPKAADELRSHGNDVMLVAELDKAMSDAEILDWSHIEGRTVITLDKDFGKLAVLLGKLHCGIVRLVDIHPMEQANTVLDAIRTYGAELVSRSIITVSKDRSRIRVMS